MPDRTTAVPSVKFPLSAAAAAALSRRAARVALLVSHPRYQARAELAGATIESVSRDLAG